MKKSRITTQGIVAALLFAMATGWASAADSSPESKAVDRLANARALLAQKNWAGAAAELTKVDDRSSADWNNLMGYSLRKADPANYERAERFYDDALQIDPRHRGALEYSGELYLMTGNLPMAEQRLAALDKACLLPCKEHAELKRAVGRYKSAGNKYLTY